MVWSHYQVSLNISIITSNHYRLQAESIVDSLHMMALSYFGSRAGTLTQDIMAKKTLLDNLNYLNRFEIFHYFCMYYLGDSHFESWGVFVANLYVSVRWSVSPLKLSNGDIIIMIITTCNNGSILWPLTASYLL